LFARSALLVALSIVGIASTVRAGDGPEEPIVERAWFKKAPWTQDYEKAREEARTSKKIVLGYFTQHH
jgi:hypothetical protein